MNPAAHVLFGALFAVLLIAFGVEYPRRRQGLSRSELGLRSIVAIIVTLALLATAPQATRYFGDRKLDSGPLLNLFVFHDVLDLLGDRFRLGDQLLDTPVTVFALAFGVTLLFLFYLRSGDSQGWKYLWRDVAYFGVIVLCLIALRVAVSSKTYIYMPQTPVYVHGELYLIVGNTVFSPRSGGTPVVGTVRDEAMAVYGAFLIVNSSSWEDAPPAVRTAVGLFLNPPIYQPALEYDYLVQLMAVIQQTPGAAPDSLARRIIAAGTLPRRDMPLGVIVGLPLVAFAVCGYLLYPYIELD